MKNPLELSDFYLDALKEMGSIGSGNSASALSFMLDRPVKISVPKLKIIDCEAVTESMGGPEKIMVGLLLCLSGDISGMIMFLLSKEFATSAVNILTKGNLREDGYFNEMEESAIKEAGNIMASSYVNAMASLTGLRISISVPSINVDMVGSLLSVPAIYYANISNQIILIENNFNENLENASCHVLLIPEEDSLEKILRGLELD